MDSAPDPTSIDLATRLDVHSALGRIVATSPISPSLRQVVIGAPLTLAGEPGNDVMVRLVTDRGMVVRRRYSVRAVDRERDEITLWVSVDHEGPGSRWALTARPGDEVDLVGPRGKITLDPEADWYLFIGDVSGLGAFYRMAEAVEIPGRVVFIVEIDDPADAVTTSFNEGLGVTGIFVDRAGRAAHDPEGLLRGLAALELPPNVGHAYLFGEFAVTRVVAAALEDRGFEPERISRKAFWRSGQENGERGEPDKS